VYTGALIRGASTGRILDVLYPSEICYRENTVRGEDRRAPIELPTAKADIA
jgi:hypothetical protein